MEKTSEEDGKKEDFFNPEDPERKTEVIFVDGTGYYKNDQQEEKRELK